MTLTTLQKVHIHRVASSPNCTSSVYVGPASRRDALADIDRAKCSASWRDADLRLRGCVDARQLGPFSDWPVVDVLRAARASAAITDAARSPPPASPLGIVCDAIGKAASMSYTPSESNCCQLHSRSSAVNGALLPSRSVCRKLTRSVGMFTFVRHQGQWSIIIICHRIVILARGLANGSVSMVASERSVRARHQLHRNQPAGARPFVAEEEVGERLFDDVEGGTLTEAGRCWGLCGAWQTWREEGSYRCASSATATRPRPDWIEEAVDCCCADRKIPREALAILVIAACSARQLH